MMNQPQPTPPQGHPPQPTIPGGGTGAATQMRPQMGAGAQGLTLVRTGVEALQKALVGIPMGSELHTAVLKAITDISRRMESGGGDKAGQTQALAAMARDNQSNPQAAVMQRMFPQAGGEQQPPQMGQ